MMNKNKTILELDEFKRKAKWNDDIDGVMVRKRMNIGTKVIDDDKRIIEFTSSTKTRDRDGDTINNYGWDLSNFKKNPLFLWGHDYSKPSIGRVITSNITTNSLKQTVQFMGADVANNEEYKDWPDWLKFADLVYQMYKNKYLNAVSVGFNPESWEWADEAEGNINFDSQELLELSAVTVPSNPDAVQAAGLGQKRLLDNYYKTARKYMSFDDMPDDEVIEIIDNDTKFEDEVINLDEIEFEEKIDVCGVLLTQKELSEMIFEAVAEQIKQKTGRIL